MLAARLSATGGYRWRDLRRHVVTCRAMLVSDGHVPRRRDAAVGLGLRAARVEAAARRRVHRRRDLLAQQLHIPHTFQGRIRHRNRRQQRLRVRMARRSEDRVARPFLDDLAEVHDGYPVTDVTNHAEIVGDE